MRARDRQLQRLGEHTAAPAVAENGRSGGDRVVDTADGIGDRAEARRTQELQREELDIPGHAGHAQRVVADRADRARDVGPVAVVVHRVVVVVAEVPAADVVDEAVAVVVDAVAGDLAGVDPDVVGQVRVGVVDPGVDYRHDDVSASREEIPRVDSGDVCARYSAGEPRVVQAPLKMESRVVGQRLGLDEEVRLEQLEARVVPVARERLGDRQLPQPQQVGVDALEVSQRASVEGGPQGLLLRDVHAGAELDDQLLGSVAGKGRRIGRRSDEQHSRRQRGEGTNHRCGPTAQTAPPRPSEAGSRRAGLRRASGWLPLEAPLSGIGGRCPGSRWRPERSREPQPFVFQVDRALDGLPPGPLSPDVSQKVAAEALRVSVRRSEEAVARPTASRTAAPASGRSSIQPSSWPVVSRVTRAR